MLTASTLDEKASRLKTRTISCSRRMWGPLAHPHAVPTPPAKLKTLRLNSSPLTWIQHILPPVLLALLCTSTVGNVYLLRPRFIHAQSICIDFSLLNNVDKAQFASLRLEKPHPNLIVHHRSSTNLPQTSVCITRAQ